MEKPKLALRAWGKLGGIERVSPFGSGHINDTYLVEGAGGRYILQRINTNTFQDVDGLMQNIPPAGGIFCSASTPTPFRMWMG